MNTKEQLKRARRANRTDGTQATEVVPGSEGFLDKAAVADRLGVRPRTVGEWAKQGKIPAYRIGNYLRFKWAEIEAHLAQSCQLKRGVPSAERGGLNGEFRHLTPALSPIEAERERKTKHRSTNPAL